VAVAADDGALAAMTQVLVRDQTDAHGSDHSESCERRNVRRNRKEREQHERGDRPSMSPSAANTQPGCHMGDEVQRDPTDEAERRDERK
jgi:hypothetical protein